MRLKRSLLSLGLIAVFSSAVSADNHADNHPHHHADHFTIEHLPKVNHAGNITVAPDGETAAYTLSVPRDLLAGDEDGRADQHLYIINDDGQSIPFITTNGSISALQFDSQTTKLYFKTKRDGDDNTSLYSISLNGGEAVKRFEFDTNIGDYVVHDNKLYFVAKAKKEDDDLKDKGFNAYVYEEDQRLGQIWLADLTDSDAPATSIFSDGHVTDIEMTSDGNKIVAAVAPTNLIDDYYMQRDLHVIDVNSGEVVNIIDLPGKLGGFEISPNDKHIAMHAGTDIHDSSDGVLMVADINSPELTQLTKEAEQHIQDVDWNGSNILAVAHRGVESALVLYSKTGGEKRTYTVSNDVVVRSADVAEGTVFFTADSPQHPREVFKVIRNKGQKLTSHNAWLDELELAEQRHFNYTARDGRTIQSLLITPNGEAPAGGWPLITMVHGGPEAHYSDGWITAYSLPGQFAAARGYAVVYPNYRGSTGRGVAFAKEHQNDYAGKEFDDLVDVVNALVEEGVVNKDRVGITGGSYGGYASMWGATAQSETFAAAVAFVGISNQVSKFGTSDIPNEMHLVHSLKWPWEDNWMNLMERSPLYHAGKANTPILILHGEKDTRVHPSQSMELFRSIKVRTNTPVRLVFYPNEAHGNRFAAGQYDYALRLMRWFDTYLAEDATRDDPKPPFDLNLSEKFEQDKEDAKAKDDVVTD